MSYNNNIIVGLPTKLLKNYLRFKIEGNLVNVFTNKLSLRKYNLAALIETFIKNIL